MTIIHDGAAQMIVAGPETWAGGYQLTPGAWLMHNNSTTNAIYMDVNQNVQAVAGTGNFIIPPGASVTVTGGLTYWARTADGMTADLHIVPTATFGQSGGTAPAASGATIFLNPG